MHGMRRIKVVFHKGREASKTLLLEYSAPAHPQMNETIQIDEDLFAVTGIRHVIKKYNDGSGASTLNFVEVEVIKV